MATIELEGHAGWWKRPVFWTLVGIACLISRTPPLPWLVAALLSGILIGGARAFCLSRLKLRLMNLSEWALALAFVGLLFFLTTSHPELRLPAQAYFGLGCAMQAANGLTFGLAVPPVMRKINQRNRRWLKKPGDPPVEPR